MAKLRHIALSVKDPEKTADFYCAAFDMKRVGVTDSPLATGVYVSDGVITMAILKYKSDEWAGYVEGEDERGKDFMGRPTGDDPDTFYEMKFRDPNGIIIDATHLGWGGSVKDVVPASEAETEKV